MLRKNAKDYRVRRQPNTAAGKALHAVAAFFGAIARAVLRRRNAEAVRNFDVGSVLETFLREGEAIRYSSTVEAERARDARTHATVVDEDGTEVAYHISKAMRQLWDSTVASIEFANELRHDSDWWDTPKPIFFRAPDVLRFIANKHPEVFAPFGGFDESLQLVVHPTVIAKMYKGMDTRKMGGPHSHNLEIEDVYRLIDEIDNPLAVIRDVTGDGTSLIFLTQLTEEVEKKGRVYNDPVMIPVRIAKSRGRIATYKKGDDGKIVQEKNYTDFYQIPTGYGLGKEKRLKYINAIQNSPNYTLLYVNEQKVDALLEEEKDARSGAGSMLGSAPQEPALRSIAKALRKGLSRAQNVPNEKGLSQFAPDWATPSAPSIIDQEDSETQGENKSDPNEERSNHISDLFTGARLSYDKPDLHFVGTGEGAQVYGWGHYSSASRGVAQDEYARRYVWEYKRAMRNLKGAAVFIGGKPYSNPDDLRMDYGRIQMDFWNVFDRNGRGGSVVRDANGDYVVTVNYTDGNKTSTYNQELVLYAAADIVMELNPELIFSDDRFEQIAWYFENGSYEHTKQSILSTIEDFQKNDEEGSWVFLATELLNGPLKSKKEFETFVKKLTEKTNNPKPNLPLPAVMRQTWWTHRPAGNESHLLNWFEDISEENFQRVAMAAKDAGATEAELDDLGDSVRTGGDAYEWLGRFFEKKNGLTRGEAKKAASEALYAHDIDGVKYPVASFHNPANQDGRKGWNYVAFSDEHLRVDHVYEYNPETDDFERKWHETRGAGSRFTETPLGQELVAHAFDVLIGVDADLLLRPWHYGEKREPGKGLVTAGLGREVNPVDEKGFAAEVSARISRFGTREGDPTLREIRARCGSKERFYEVLGAVFEAAVGLKLGVQDVITQREFGTMEKRMPLYAWVIRHNAQARATALGRKAYIMGRAFAERLHKEALAEARAEVERQRAKASEARAQTREAKAQTRNAERREETARIKLKKAEFSAAEADFIARWRLAEERAISRMRRTCNKSECIKAL